VAPSLFVFNFDAYVIPCNSGGCFWRWTADFPNSVLRTARDTWIGEVADYEARHRPKTGNDIRGSIQLILASPYSHTYSVGIATCLVKINFQLSLMELPDGVFE
jgi:hypothetical protein